MGLFYPPLRRARGAILPPAALRCAHGAIFSPRCALRSLAYLVSRYALRPALMGLFGTPLRAALVKLCS